MMIGHVNLEKSMNGTGEHFVKLVEGLDRQGVRQHVLVANGSLARRVAVYENVSVGPVVRTAVIAFCLMPDVDVAHLHDARSSQAGLVLRLTRSIPYILTRRTTTTPALNPVARSILNRSAGITCPTETAASALAGTRCDAPVDVIPDISHELGDADHATNQIAAEHHRIYRRAADTRRIPALLI
ncbi:MAG: glycosyltransferase [Gammaproteobacteria bacterium]|nr:glycosyltransferase [Gammaproteobacteria bacterium]